METTTLNQNQNQHAPLLEVEGLKTYFHTSEGVVRAVDGVNFTIGAGEVVGLVGESGCGKSATALSVLKLIPDPPGKIVGGQIRFKGQNLPNLPEKQLRQLRGNRISMIFQEPMTALNPVFTIGNQVGEVFRVHRGMSRSEAMKASVEVLRQVRIPEPEQRAHEYPHQLSGGMRQRVMIAMALACQPDLLIADEPTTALDVTVQAQILALIDQLRRERNCAVMLITHDLGVVAEVCHRVIVMYAGEVVETSSVDQLFASPLHPYTRALLKCIPRVDCPDKALAVIPGNVPDAGNYPTGCRFWPRCQDAMPCCQQHHPELLPDRANQSRVRCFLHHPHAENDHSNNLQNNAESGQAAPVVANL